MSRGLDVLGNPRRRLKMSVDGRRADAPLPTAPLLTKFLHARPEGLRSAPQDAPDTMHSPNRNHTHAPRRNGAVGTLAVATLALLLPVAPLHAGTADELKARLEAMTGATPIEAQLEIEVSGEEGAGDEPIALDGKAGATVRDGPEGVTVTFARDSVEAATAEASDEDGGGRHYGARHALNSIGATLVRDHLNAAPLLLRHLGRGTVVDEREDTIDGRPARLLVLTATPKLNPQAKKYVKHFTVTVHIWLGDDGVPVAASVRHERKGRALLVVSFESVDEDDYRFRAVGDRLVVLRRERTSSGSGAGTKSNSKMVTTVAVRGRG